MDEGHEDHEPVDGCLVIHAEEENKEESGLHGTAASVMDLAASCSAPTTSGSRSSLTIFIDRAGRIQGPGTSLKR